VTLKGSLKNQSRNEKAGTQGRNKKGYDPATIIHAHIVAFLQKEGNGEFWDYTKEISVQNHIIPLKLSFYYTRTPTTFFFYFDFTRFRDIAIGGKPDICPDICLD
jgi:hypothetical protein